MKPFQVIVGNIGTVYDGSNFMVARTTFNRYAKQSAANIGRAAGEDVTLMHDGVPRVEHFGSNQQEI